MSPPDRYSDVDGALRTAMKAINKATIAGQELESISECGAPANASDFRALYRALRVAREHVQLVLRTYLKDLRVQDSEPGRRGQGAAILRSILDSEGQAAE